MIETLVILAFLGFTVLMLVSMFPWKAKVYSVVLMLVPLVTNITGALLVGGFDVSTMLVLGIASAGGSWFLMSLNSRVAG